MDHDEIQTPRLLNNFLPLDRTPAMATGLTTPNNGARNPRRARGMSGFRLCSVHIVQRIAPRVCGARRVRLGVYIVRSRHVCGIQRSVEDGQELRRVSAGEWYNFRA
jgi:hypothetical protein